MRSLCRSIAVAVWVALSEALVAGAPDPPVPETSPDAPAVWEFPAIRGAHRAWFRWSMELRTGIGNARAEMQEAVTSGTLPLVMAAVVAARETETTATLAIGQAQALEDRARAFTLEPPRRWGAQPLLHAFADRSSSLDSAPRALLRQFLPDHVRGNSLGAAELYVLGLRHDPTRFEGPLAEVVASGDVDPQLRLMTDNLLLLHVIGRTRHPDFERASWYQLLCSVGDEAEEPWQPLRHLDRLAGTVARRNLAVAGLPMVATIDSLIARNTRRMAWWWMEADRNLTGRECADILKREHRLTRREIAHLGAIWTMRDAASLADPRHAAGLAKIVQAEPGIIADVFRFASSPRCCRNCVWATIDNILWRPVDELCEEPLTFSARTAQQLRAALYRMVEMGKHPGAELAIIELLRDLDGEPALDRLGANLVAHLADDATEGNAVRARWVVLDSGYGAAAAEALMAGVRQGVLLDDPQLIRNSAELLWEQGHPVAEAAALDYMARQFRNDGRVGNAEHAMWYLIACGEAARPYAEALVRDGDDQERRYGALILRALEPPDPDH